MDTKKKVLWGLVYTLVPLAIVAAVLVGMPGGKVSGADNTAASPTALDRLSDLSDAFAAVAEKASPSVVYIETENEIDLRSGPILGPFDMLPDEFWRPFFGPNFPGPQRPDIEGRGRQQIRVAQGTGFVLSSDGYIVTNHHVVENADGIHVKLADGREFDAKLVGSDRQTEVALLKIEATGLPALRLGDSDQIRVGEWVLAIGNPFGLSHTVTAGIVSAKGRGNVPIGDPDFYRDFIQTDASINPGNSGGPLLNLKGEVVGLNTAIISRTGGYMGIGFAIPINMVKFIEQQLRDTGSITRGFLGVSIQDLTPDLGQWFKTTEGKGALVTGVSKDSPAEKAGLKQDDIVVAYNGQPVEEVQSFRSRVASTAPGTKVDLGIIRDGKRITKTVEVGSLGPEVADAETQPGALIGNFGLTVQDLTPDLAERLGYQGQSGVVIAQVEPGSVAAMAGLRPGIIIQEVNRKPVDSAQALQKAMAQTKSDEAVLLRVTDEQRSFYVVLSVK